MSCCARVIIMLSCLAHPAPTIRFQTSRFYRNSATLGSSCATKGRMFPCSKEHLYQMATGDQRTMQHIVSHSFALGRSCLAARTFLSYSCETVSSSGCRFGLSPSRLHACTYRVYTACMCVHTIAISDAWLRLIPRPWKLTRGCCCDHKPSRIKYLAHAC